MSSTVNHPDQAAIDSKKRERNKIITILHEQNKLEGLGVSHTKKQSNSTCQYKTVEEERCARAEVVTNQVKIMSTQLPQLIKRLSKIEDPRNPKKIKHKLTLLMVYGILMFVFQVTSRREADREMTLPVFKENIKMLFPEIDKIPHNDTLMRLLVKIDPHEIEQALIDTIKKLIRNKKFTRYMIDKHYPVAIDGTQKFAMDYIWAEECQERTVGKDGQKQYYVYVLEASLAFQNGMTIPLMSEFLSYKEGDIDTKKQDCEIKAFKRLAKRVKSVFPRLRICILVDGLYANGPIMEVCRNKHWDFMIVLKDKSLPTVWEEYYALKGLESKNTYKMKWKNRKQSFTWVNNIEYYYDNGKTQIIHVVVCNETWNEVDKKTNKIVALQSKHAWISNKPLSKKNIHERCNLVARHRWNIEAENLVEKRYGYQYEHCFSYNWNAMKGYHFLMRIGLMLNVLAQYSECMINIVQSLGMRGTIKFVFDSLKGPWFNKKYIQKIIKGTTQLRLI